MVIRRPEDRKALEASGGNTVRRRGGTQAVTNVKLMYKLRDEVPVTPRLGFEETCREVARTEAGPLFAKKLAAAIRTAK